LATLDWNVFLPFGMSGIFSIFKENFAQKQIENGMAGIIAFDLLMAFTQLFRALSFY